jgi:hypothetical protein
LVQGVLNHSRLPGWLEEYGVSLPLSADFTEALVEVGIGKVRLLIKAAVSEQYKEQLAEEQLSFLRTKALYQHCMEVANEKYGWTKQWL